ncbi:MAG: gamma-glutamylcyclotransferase family protein [bacterium]
MIEKLFSKRIYYFAYGSNMSHKQMKERCPGAKYICRAFLENHRIVFDGHSAKTGGAVANIVTSLKNKVWGCVYRMSLRDLDRLDGYEGLKSRQYRRKQVHVLTDNGKVIEALAYYRKNKKRNQPSGEYFNTIIEGANNCKLPDEYIERLRTLQ